MRLSWLPYSHIYARTLDHYLSIAAGQTVALAESAETVVDNLTEVQPTHLNAVPRFYEKVLTAEARADPAETGRRLRASSATASTGCTPAAHRCPAPWPRRITRPACCCCKATA